MTPFTRYRWRKEPGGLKSDQVKRLKDLEKDRAIGTPLVRETMARERMRKAVSDLTLEKLILRGERLRAIDGAGGSRSHHRDMRC